MNKKIAQDEVKAQDRSVKMGVFDKFLDIMKLNDDEYEDDDFYDDDEYYEDDYEEKTASFTVRKEKCKRR